MRRESDGAAVVGRTPSSAPNPQVRLHDPKHKPTRASAADRGIRPTSALCLVSALVMTSAIAFAQRGGVGADAVARGAEVFSQSCATGYCHGVKGTSGGAPRLVSRGFDGAYITNVVRSGIQGTGMPAFGTTLNRADLAAVTAYVGSLNGIAPAALPAIADRGMPRRQLPPEAQKGRTLFYEAARGFGRCSTCHQVDGVGIAVADPIAKVPGDVAALKSLASPHMSTATEGGSTFPALVLSKGAVNVKLYDFTTSLPVLRTFASKDVKVTDGSTWKHSSAMSAYSDAELESILGYLKVAMQP